MDVSTDFLRTFIAVCEYKSFSRATAKVHKSQAAISTQIAKLEEQAGSKFIDRSQRQFRLTQEGELFLNFAREIVAKTNAAQQSLQSLHSGLSGEVRIGTTRSVGIYILPDVISSIAKNFPNLKISLLTQGRTLTYERLQQGSVDLALVLADVVPRGFFAKPLRSEPLCYVISPKHPLASKKVISREELKTVPFISGVKGNDFSDMIDEIFEKDGIRRPTGGITINNLRVRKEAVRAGVGVTVLPSFTVRDEVQSKTLKVLAIEGGRLPDTQLMIVEARHRSPNANVELVKKALVEKLAIGSRHH
ncbi:MAG TPA: LysR family transcriptional regulator [Candidatus Binatia bacterium]|jgi:DNA-binding transcriptional LysR family regulator|nr:LysR family transcriptional regulator [Candidatus Binatia bacterium]